MSASNTRIDLEKASKNYDVRSKVAPKHFETSRGKVLKSLEMMQSKAEQKPSFTAMSSDKSKSADTHHPEISNHTLEQALFSNICRGEELRGRLIAVMSIAAIAIFIPISFLFEERFAAVFSRSIPRVGITQILLFTALYGYLASKTFGNRRNLSLLRFQAARYVNATVEAALPSILLIGVTHILQGPEALASPPVLIYFLFIILSALRFDLGLAVYTGFICGLGYLYVATYFVPNAWVSGSGSVLQEPLHRDERGKISGKD